MNVLIVEDESLVASLVEDMVHELGHRVVKVCSRSNRAVEFLEGNACDFAILDVNLDGGRSYEVAKVLADRQIPFVFATGYGNAGIEETWGHIPVIQKPFEKEALRSCISRALP